MLEQTPPTDAQWEQLARIDGGEPPRAAVTFLGLFGYFDAGVPGLLLGVAIGAFAMLYANWSVRRRRRSRS